MGPIPPPFPNGKGACCVMAVVIFRAKQLLFEKALASPTWGTSYPKRSRVVDGRGVFLFCITIPLCRLRISSQAKQ